MNFVCTFCGRTLKRDLRLKANKARWKKQGFFSFCIKADRHVVCEPVGSGVVGDARHNDKDKKS